MDHRRKPVTLPSPSRASNNPNTKQQRAILPVKARSGEVQFQITQVPSTSSSQDPSPTTQQQDQGIGSPSLTRSVVIRGILPTQSLYLDIHYEDHPCTCTGVSLKSEEVPSRDQKAQEEMKKKEAEKPGDEEGEEGEEETPFIDEKIRLSSWFKKTMICLHKEKLALVRTFN